MTISKHPLHPESPAIKPDDFKIGSSYITGSYSGDIKKARAYLDGTAKAIGGEFTLDGTFKYYIGSGVTIDSSLEIEGRDNDNIVVTPKISINIIE